MVDLSGTEPMRVVVMLTIENDLNLEYARSLLGWNGGGSARTAGPELTCSAARNARIASDTACIGTGGGRHGANRSIDRVDGVGGRTNAQWRCRDRLCLSTIRDNTGSFYRVQGRSDTAIAARYAGPASGIDATEPETAHVRCSSTRARRGHRPVPCAFAARPQLYHRVAPDRRRGADDPVTQDQGRVTPGQMRRSRRLHATLDRAVSAPATGDAPWTC